MTRLARTLPAAALLAASLSGCSITGGLASSLSAAMLNQNDPTIVADGAPAYLLMIDAMIADDPYDEDLLLAGAKLYGAYTGGFVTDPQRRKTLAERGFGYARRATCQELEELCAVLEAPFDEFQPVLAQSDEPEVLYRLGTSWAGLIQANPGDWVLIGDLPKVRALMQRTLELDARTDDGGPHAYLGVLATLLPPAMGGQPEAAREHFETAIALSDGRNQMFKVLYARHYARLVFDRELHDSLLHDVLSSREPDPDGYALVNTLARQEAKALLASGDEYF